MITFTHSHVTNQVIPSHGNPQMRWTSSDCYLFKYCSVKYQTFHQKSEKTSQQTYSHQKTTRKAFQMPPRAMKHQLTCPIELTSGSFLFGRRGILVILRNRLEDQSNCRKKARPRVSGGGALECNLARRCPFFKNLHNPFRKKFAFRHPASELLDYIIRLQKITKTIGKQ